MFNCYKQCVAISHTQRKDWNISWGKRECEDMVMLDCVAEKELALLVLNHRLYFWKYPAMRVTDNGQQ